jgi:hypothetical protein
MFTLRGNTLLFTKRMRKYEWEPVLAILLDYGGDAMADFRPLRPYRLGIWGWGLGITTKAPGH